MAGRPSSTPAPWPLDRVIAFDPATGALRCEAGVLLAEILILGVPQGWFPPVTPGIRFVTLGGAIANDVHGKNHHHRGTFGRHVRVFELLRSDGSRRVRSPTENPELYRATIGGLGLTGFITWAEIQLRAIATPFIGQETLRFENLAAFFALSEESDQDYEHTADGFIGNHSDCHRFSRYLILDFSPLFWKNTLGLNDCVH